MPDEHLAGYAALMALIGVESPTANRPMIEINEALGFRLIEQGAGYQKLVS